jgi:hypothetical protein
MENESKWPTTLLCMNCGSALGRSTGKPLERTPFLQQFPELAEPELIYGGDKDEEGEFLRCPACGGRNYYLMDAHKGLSFLKFKESQGRRRVFQSYKSQKRFLEMIGGLTILFALIWFISETLPRILPQVLIAVLIVVSLMTLVKFLRGTGKR